MARKGHRNYSFFIIQHSLFIKGVLQLILQHALFYIFSAQAARAAPIRQAFPSQTARAVRRLVPPASKTTGASAATAYRITHQNKNESVAFGNRLVMNDE